MNENDFDEFVLSKTPHFIAINYQQLLQADTPQKQIELALHIYNLGLRALTIGLISQYLIRDRVEMSDPDLNELLLDKFGHLTLDTWQQLFFAALRAYQECQDLFFMPELYEFYWDTSSLPHKCRTEVEIPFTRLSQIAMDLKKELQPQNQAEWEKLAQETISLLKQFLGGFRFIEKYDLIRVRDFDDQFYEFELHKGVNISRERSPRPRNVKFEGGQLYLRRGTEHFLRLHPFLISFEEGAPEGGQKGGTIKEVDQGELAPTETGIYDRFYAHLYYMLAIQNQPFILQDKSVAEAFIRIVYDTIEATKRMRQEAEKLTWWRLYDICNDITKHRIATVQHKYNRELYLQRNKTYQIFNNFLKSDKRCFVLVGKSGVGKSNFLLAMREELQKSDQDICMLMYDGAALNKPSITEIINGDFNDRLLLADRQVDDIWREIAQVDGIDQRLVILYIDAINENPQAQELLRQLNELVQRPLPWLKVVISSRPETWQTIKRGIRLAEGFYYRGGGDKSPEIEPGPFNYSEQMDPFSRQELPLAYANYKKIFDLQTEYESLSSELREMLRDPLSLWLVAKTYNGQVIPPKLKPTALIEEYLEALDKEHRLRKEDLRLLQKQLVPLMVKEDDYSNTITLADINAAKGELYEAIYSEQILSNGQRMNQSFTYLLETEILTKQREGREEKIVFKYERFYDYFIGEHLFETCRQVDDKVAFFEALVIQLKERIFLWGALYQLLIGLLTEKDYALIEKLGYTQNELQAELLISVLAEHYPEHQSGLKPVLTRWLEDEDEQSKAPYIAANVAIICLIEDLLERTLIHPRQAVCFLLVQDIHKVWKRDRELTVRILQALPRQISLLRLKHTREALNTLLYTSLLLVSRDYSEVGVTTETIQVVRSLWKPIIERVLLVSRVGFIEGMLKRLRRLIVRVGASSVINMLRNVERETFSFSFKDAEAFFPAGERQKQILERLTFHLDVAAGQAPGAVEDLTNYITELARHGDDNVFIGDAALASLIAHINATPLQTAQAIESLYENLADLYDPTEDPKSPTASLWIFITATFLSLSYADMTPEEARPFVETHAKLLHTRIFRYHNRLRFECGDILRFGSVDAALFGYHFNFPEFGPDLLAQIARIEIERNDHDHLKAGIPVIAMSMVRFKMPRAGVEALNDFIQILRETKYLERRSKEEQAEFWQEAADSLIERAHIYREDILDWLERFEPGEVPEEFKIRIRNASRKESIDFNIGEAVIWAINRALQDENPFLRNFIKWIFHTASEARNLTGLAVELIIYLIDFLYEGDSLFSKSKNPFNN